MNANFTALVRAGRVLECHRATALTDIATTGKPCSLFLVPLADGALEDVDFVEVAGELQYNATSTVAPVVVGDWSPVIFNSVTAIQSVADGTAYTIDVDFALYYAPIAINER